MPFSSFSPRSSNSTPAPATRSFTVCETSTSPPSARAATRPDHDGEPGHFALVQLALADVNAGPDLQAELVHSLDDRLGAANRPGWAVEGREEAVAGGVPLLAPVPSQLAPHERVVPLEHLAPRAVSELGGPLR